MATGHQTIAEAIANLGDITIYTAEQIGSILYPITSAETSAGVTPTNYQNAPSPGYDAQRLIVGDGVADDTTALANAFLVSKHVVIAPGLTPLVSSSITVPAHGKLEFLGGRGNTSGSYPASYLIKSAAMTTPALILSETAEVEGGGLICQDGNTGNGVEIRGNSARLRHFLVHNAGGDGVRVGRDGLAGQNYNSFEISHCVSQYNGGNGFHVHDGKTDPENGANANAGTLTQCFAQHNDGDGIKLGFCWWVTLVNCLSEVNTGWGLNLSGEDKETYPACRWATIVGGDYNELNTAGVINDPAYFTTFIQPDTNQHPSTASNGLQGSGARTIIGGTNTRVRGLQVYDALLDLEVGQAKFPATQNPSSNANTLDDYEEGATGAWTPAQAGVTLTVSEARYCKIGRMVWITFDLTWPSTADTTAVAITGMPFTPIGSNAGTISSGYTTYATPVAGVVAVAGIAMYGDGGDPSNQLENVDLSTERIIGSGWYMASA